MHHKGLPSEKVKFSNERSYLVASWLLATGQWCCYLEDDEGEIFKLVASSKERWLEFLAKPETLLISPESFPNGSTPLRSDGIVGRLTKPFSLVAGCRIRSMIFEQYLPKVVPSFKDFFSSVVDVDAIDKSSNQKNEPRSRSVPAALPQMIMNVEPRNNGGLKDDDNYDMDVDEEPVQSGASMAKLETIGNIVDPQVAPQLSSGQMEGVHTEEPRMNTLKPSDPDAIPIDDMYYTLEYDLLTLEKQKQTDGTSNREESTAPPATVEERRESVKPQFDIAANSNLRHIFELIDQSGETSAAQSLRQLLIEATTKSIERKPIERKNPHQHLTDALEKVLYDLKAYTEHSTPFLQRVNKREAPNYFDIIKNPMDLGTMTKRLKSSHYKTKQEFMSDLDLIWSNCLTYNTLPESPYRKHAYAMMNKSAELLKRVPEVGDSESDDEKEHDGSEEMHLLDEPRPYKRSRSSVVKEEYEEGEGTRVSRELTEDALEHFKRSDSKAADAEKVVMAQAVDVIKEEDEDCSFDDGDKQFKLWRNTTSSFRAEQCKSREKQLALPFPSRSSIKRVPLDALKLRDRESAFRKRGLKRRRITLESDTNVQEGAGAQKGLDSGTKEEVKATEREDSKHIDADVLSEQESSEWVSKLYFPEWNTPPAWLPQIPNNVVPRHIGKKRLDIDQLFADEPSVDYRAAPSLSDYPESKPDRNSWLNQNIMENSLELKRIKMLHAKILAKEAGVEDYPLPLPPPSHKPPKMTNSRRRRIPEFSLNGRAGESTIKQATAKLLAHAGFDTAQELAIDTLVDVAVQYVLNLGKTLRLYLDKYSHTKTPVEIFMHTMSENGVDSVKKLEAYLRHDVQRYGAKLLDLRKRMSHAFRNMLSANDQEVLEDDLQIEEASEQIISGNFYDDVGLDFLNLAELGMGFTSVPTELWNRKADKPIRARVRRNILTRAENQAALPEAVTPRPELESAPPAPVPLIKGGKLPPFASWDPVSPDAQIGLLRSWFVKRKAEEGEIIEDDNRLRSSRPSKAKYMLKAATTGRKRPTEDTAGGSKKKKKPAAAQGAVAGAGGSTAANADTDPSAAAKKKPKDKKKKPIPAK
ncbi:hypothetical protein BJ742DRAFT_822169 [Cladochytrium replicatum]|nr:hypothetical protein BJ742DRAFT_822169 [Cladochytrium replicatum]